MILLQGKPFAEKIYSEIKKQVDQFESKPKLVAILANSEEASRMYLEKKKTAALRAGIEFFLDEVPVKERTTEELCSRVRALNSDPNTHGIIIQLPLEEGIDDQKIFDVLNPIKDVDGLHPANIGGSLLGLSGLRPATAKAIIELLQFYGITLANKHVVVVGRSRIVGKPLIGMLLAADATVTICHRQTKDLENFTRNADILIVATGVSGLITKDMVKPGAVVVDAGWSRVDGKSKGDVNENVQEVASAFSPVPGGVGPATVAMLLFNTIEAYKLQKNLLCPPKFFR